MTGNMAFVTMINRIRYFHERQEPTVKKSISLFLCFALLFSFAACGKPAAPEQTPEQEPVPTAAEVYAGAAEQLQAQGTLRIKHDIKQYTAVGADQFAENITQTVELSGLNTESFSATYEERCNYGKITSNLEAVYVEGILYSNLNGYAYQCEATSEEFFDLVIPVVLLDPALYGVVEWDGEDKISFAEPTAAESWLGIDMEALEEASGTAELDEEGQLTRSSYHAVFRLGGAKVTLNISSKVMTPIGKEITKPEDAADYRSLPDPYVPQMVLRAAGLTAQSKAISYNQTYTVNTQAGGAVKVQTSSVNCCGALKDLMAKADYEAVLTEYSGKVTNSSMNERFENGVYTCSYDGSAAEEDASLTASDMQYYYQTSVCQFFPQADGLEEYTISDLGGCYLIEFQNTDELSLDLKEIIVYDLWGNEKFLDDLSSDYRTETSEGYLSIDKYTGLPLSLGLTYSGVHTIDGVEYVLAAEVQQSMSIGSPWIALSISEERPAPDESLEAPTPLFYHVTGSDGEEMWLLGTIHVGDSRTERLPQEIYDAFAASDALALEFDSGDYMAQLENDPELASSVMQSYLYMDGSTVKDHIEDEELYEDAVKMLKAAGEYNAYAEYMRAVILGQLIDNFYLRQSYTLTNDYGVDGLLEELAREQGKPILNVESGLEQLQMLVGFSDALQEVLLAESVYTGQQQSNEGTLELFELWCQGDEAALTKALERDTESLSEEELAEYEEYRPLLEEYDKAMIGDRNLGMLEVAKEYLSGGQTVFYAVGLGHLLSEGGLVQLLRDAGYTVELVSYQ